MLYWIFYISMLVGYLGLSILSSDLKTKVIGVLLTLVNALIGWKNGIMTLILKLL